VIELEAGAVAVGRRPDEAGASLRIDDDLMSRTHALLTVKPRGDTLGIRDLQSRNGTWLNGVRITQAEATAGDILRLGDSVFAIDRKAPDLRHEGVRAAVPGSSSTAAAMRTALAVAADDRPTLIIGATGTGKEYAAAALHELSERHGPLVRINVAAVPDTLFESEFFGHARGAFSGATGARRGRFLEADGGTLVLDEVGELPMALQAKLLRVIEDGVVRPVGGTSDIRVDVKVVASTNRDPDKAVAAGRLRADLLARLRMNRVDLVPLAERRGDILELADVVQPSRVAGAGGWAEALDADAAEALLCHDWPDNLRGLGAAMAAVNRGMVAGLDPVSALPPNISVPADSADPEPNADPAPPPRRGGALGVDGPTGTRHHRSMAPDRAVLEQLLVAKAGNINAVGRALGCDRRQVYRWLAAAGIDRAELKRYRS